MPDVAISAPNEAAADAGEQIALAGGNAIDAALAATLVTMVNEVGIVSLSSGGFITVQPPDGSAPHTVDGWMDMPGRGRTRARHRRARSQRSAKRTCDHANGSQHSRPSSGARRWRSPLPVAR